MSPMMIAYGMGIHAQMISVAATAFSTISTLVALVATLDIDWRKPIRLATRRTRPVSRVVFRLCPQSGVAARVRKSNAVDQILVVIHQILS